MKHYVFSAANIQENDSAIETAKKAAENIKLKFEMEATITGMYNGSTVLVENSGYNTSVYVEDNDIHRLIDSAILFSREYDKLRMKGD